MRKILFLLPLLLSIHACGTQPLPTQAIAPPDSQAVVAQPTGSSTTLLPDLSIKLIYVEMEGRQGNCVEAYTPYGIRVLVENTGLASAGPFLVDLNGTQKEIEGLAVSQVIEIHFAGTVQNGQYKASADVTNRVVEQQEDNNSLFFVAPTPTPPPLCTATSAPYFRT